MKYQYLLLDWDGNLAKTLDIWLEACQDSMQKRNIHVSDEQIGAGFGAFEEHMVDWGVTDPEVAMDEMVAIAKENLPEVELYPDALFVLESLKKARYKLALVTTSSHQAVDHLLAKHNMTDIFDAVVTSDDVVHRKPHPEPLEKALASLAGVKERAIMIGDSDKDIGAANNFGIDSILFHSSEHQKYHNLAALQKLRPTYTIDDFKQVLDIV